MNETIKQPTNDARWDVLNSRSNTIKWLLALYRNGAYYLAPSEAENMKWTEFLTDWVDDIEKEKSML